MNKNINSKFLKTPLNYTGNKFRILNEIFKVMPDKCDVFVDLFCGGGSIGVNYNAKKIFMIDTNEKVINLLSYLSKQNFDKLYKKISLLIYKYNLTFSYENTYKFYKNKIDYSNQSLNNGLKSLNQEGFYKMREDYNKIKNKNTDRANILLYILMIYSFNNDLRFNSKGFFNLPVGKTDMNKQNILKLKNFLNTIINSEIIFIISDFRSEEVRNILEIADVIYADPPYLGTTAFYNSTPPWTIVEEKYLLKLSKEMANKNKKFYISNVIKKNEVEERFLCEFIEENDYKVYNINYHYRSASYNKKNRKQIEQEVLIEAI
ncbi:MAG: DNA adenine methylase [Mycoplasmataceae bacterium]|nr:DNA adenine methylase [Mycoplasmataceae bacterium]